MKPDIIAGLYTAHVEKLVSVLQQFDEQKFITSPKEGGWSAAQVASHICATTEKCIANALLCAAGKGERGKPGLGAAIFSWMGSFPPVKIKVKKIPAGLERVYNPQPVTKAEAIDLLRKSAAQVQDSLMAITHADPSVRIAHWAGGWFNAQQWMHNAEMHIKHHFRQFGRIMKTLKVN